MTEGSSPLAVESLRCARRIAVAGVSGVGKSTFARRLGATLGLPYTELDALFHGPGWTERPSFVDDVRALAASDAWVTEWQYGPARPILAARAQVMVWLDLPTALTLARVSRRTLSRRLRRTELFGGNVEPPLWTFLTDREHILRWAISTRRKYRTLVPEAAANPGLRVVRLRRPREVDALLTALGR